MSRFGARLMWSAALGLFLLGSVLSGMARSAGSLVAFRVLQGLGGGMILPLTQLILARAAGPQRLGRVMGVVGIVGQLAPISGPLLGGLLIDGWVFFVNVPIVAVSLVMTWRWFPRGEERRRDQPVDLVGFAVLPAGVVSLVYALSALGSTSEAVSQSGTITAAVAGTVLLAVFVVRAARRGEAGLIDLRLFGDHSFRGGAVMMFLLGVTTWGPMFLLPLYYQQVRGLSAFDTGIVPAPQSIGLAAAFLVVGRYADRAPSRSRSPRPKATRSCWLSRCSSGASGSASRACRSRSPCTGLSRRRPSPAPPPRAT